MPESWPRVLSVQLNLLGVRGSTPVSGRQFLKYGGHTSCVAVTATGSSRPTLILDAGTGLQGLTNLLDGHPFNGAILLSHLHWDHMQGLPFFRSGDNEDADVSVYLPAQEGRTGEALLTQTMSPPAFPITPMGLRGTWSFTAIEPGTYDLSSFTVTAAEVRHKGGRAFGYRVSDGTSHIAYLPDRIAKGELTDELKSLVHGVDLLIHDAQFVETESQLAHDYGHSTIGEAVEFASGLDVKRLVLFHHAPARTDDELDAIAAELDAPLPVEMAREAQVLHVS